MTRRYATLAVGIMLMSWAMACSQDQAPPDPPTPLALPRIGPNTAFAVLPDTQYYACGFPHIFEAQGRWILEQAAELGVGIVLHTGDVVDADIPGEWAVAANAMHLLDGHVTYLIAPGNHDLRLDRSSLINDFFVAEDLVGEDTQGTSFLTPGGIENSSAIVELRGRPWLFIGLEFAPRDSTLDWANRVLEEYEDLPAVLFTHAYLYADGARYDRSLPSMQEFHPDIYAVTPEEGINDGEDIWQLVVEPNRNVHVVLSGHVVPDGVERSEAMRSDGSVVHQVLTNYQHCIVCPCAEVEGGGGYLRVFSLSEDETALRVQTYSPHFDEFLTDGDNEFELQLSL